MLLHGNNEEKYIMRPSLPLCPHLNHSFPRLLVPSQSRLRYLLCSTKPPRRNEKKKHAELRSRYVGDGYHVALYSQLYVTLGEDSQTTWLSAAAQPHTNVLYNPSRDVHLLVARDIMQIMQKITSCVPRYLYFLF